MIVRAIKVQHNRETDRIVITFEIDPASWRNMDRSARAEGHVDTLNYVEATINDAFFDDEAAKGETRGAPDANEPARADEDLDDGIPF